MFGVARNVVSAEHRRAARDQQLQHRIAGRRLLDDDDIERLQERIDAGRDSRALIEAMARLPDSERAVLELVTVDQLTVTEAAAALGIRAVTARVRLHRARSTLRDTGSGDAHTRDAPTRPSAPGTPVPTAQPGDTMTVDLNPFEQRLLHDLRAVVAANPEPEPGSAKGRARPARQRVALGGALAGVTTLAATAVLSGGTSLAYAVDKNADGNVTVTIHSLQDPAGLESRAAGRRCPRRRHVPPDRQGLPAAEPRAARRDPVPGPAARFPGPAVRSRSPRTRTAASVSSSSAVGCPATSPWCSRVTRRAATVPSPSAWS